MVVLLAPGQGSQSPGMLASWLELPGARETVSRWSEAAGLDLAAAGTTWDAEAIRDTAVAQPLLAASALLSARILLEGGLPVAVCGHSVGELPALALAGVLTDDDAVLLAARRGRAMAAAAARRETGMAAVLGGDPDQVADLANRLGLEVATVNVTGQVVLGGPVPSLTQLAATPPAGARVRLLDVAGAFHTAAMADAVQPLREALAAVRPADPRTAVVANADGGLVTTGQDAAERLVRQLTGPVRFDLCLAALAPFAATGVVELAPAGTLTPLVKRGLPGTAVVALRTPDDLAAARALLPHGGEQPDLTWRALPAPEAGVVDRLVRQGDQLCAGDAVAVVAGRAGASTVVAPVDGTVTEWLVSAGDPVRAGQLLAVLA
jgi:[acyl-carrier-protein] S-malonyltransferase